MSAPRRRKLGFPSQAVDADDVAEVAGSSRLDAGELVVEQDHLVRIDAEASAAAR